MVHLAGAIAKKDGLRDQEKRLERWTCKSPAWKAFDAERDKAQKTTTRFVVEVEK